jgi:phosphohistidine phosphatase
VRADRAPLASKDMGQQLWLLRHGAAEPHGVRPDADRRLTERGEAQSRKAGKALAKMDIGFDAILTSPRVRARETANLAAEPLGMTPEVHETLTGGFSREDALELMSRYGVDAKVLLVGHEPDFSQLIHDFTGGRAEMKKGGLAGMRIARGAGDLLVLMRPRELELMG